MTSLEMLARSLRPRSLTGKVALVTGATAGIGRAVVERLSDAGAVVVAVARDDAALAELARTLPGVSAHPADLADDVERRDLVEAVLRRHGRVDVLVADVGIGWVGEVADMTTEQVRRVVDVNVTATVDLTRQVVRHQLDRRDGDVVLLGSGAAWFSMPPLTVYCATKAAVEGFGEGLRREVMTRGVRVHVVNPGFVATEFAARSGGDEPGEVDGTPRPGPGLAPERVARAVERALTRPGWHTVSVPRVMGLTRVARLPLAQQVADVVVGVAGPALARLGPRMAADRAGSGLR
ncbi:SDR family oxidoreductase [Thalassiella azotivora]